MKICNRKTFLFFLSLFLGFSDISAAKKWQILGLALLKILDRDRSRVWNFHYVSGNRRAECKLRIGKRDERVANYGKSLIRYRVGGEFFNSRRLIFPIRAIESIGMKYFHYHRHIRFHRFENRIGKPRPVQEWNEDRWRKGRKRSKTDDTIFVFKPRSLLPRSKNRPRLSPPNGISNRAVSSVNFLPPHRV